MIAKSLQYWRILESRTSFLNSWDFFFRDHYARLSPLPSTFLVFSSNNSAFISRSLSAVPSKSALFADTLSLYPRFLCQLEPTFEDHLTGKLTLSTLTFQPPTSQYVKGLFALDYEDSQADIYADMTSNNLPFALTIGDTSVPPPPPHPGKWANFAKEIPWDGVRHVQRKGTLLNSISLLLLSCEPMIRPLGRKLQCRGSPGSSDREPQEGIKHADTVKMAKEFFKVVSVLLMRNIVPTTIFAAQRNTAVFKVKPVMSFPALPWSMHSRLKNNHLP